MKECQIGVAILKETFIKVTGQRIPAKFILIVLSVTFLPGCLLHRHRGSEVGNLNPGDQPDKILFERATKEIEKGRYDVGRLTLQTLINTYPDSEYLAKAKLEIADSYYSEGGTSGLTQAEAEYKDFITFFPTAPEAPEAQFRAGMAHFKLMGKADRDRTEAKLAEAEFKEFLLKYPDSAVMPRVKARLRQVQEVLAQGDYKIAKFYFTKGANRAARSRFQEIADLYPSFSEGDQALWYLGLTLERLKQPNFAVPYYARIITEHPLSPLVDDAKGKLTAMHQPIPRPTRAMLARAHADAANRTHRDVFSKFGGLLSSAPDTSATRHGPVRLGGPKPGEVEVAKAPTTAPASGGNVVVAQPAGDAALKSGTAVDPNAAGNGAAKEAEKDTNAQPKSDPPAAQAPTPSGGGSSDPASVPKKKGHRSLFKRIVKPF